MKALSLTQPMAWAIFNGKDVENRTWPTKCRGRVMIHASQGLDKAHYEFIWLNDSRLGCQLPPRSEFVHGAIIGPVLYAEPIPCKGRLGFFTPAL